MEGDGWPCRLRWNHTHSADGSKSTLTPLPQSVTSDPCYRGSPGSGEERGKVGHSLVASADRMGRS